MSMSYEEMQMERIMEAAHSIVPEYCTIHGITLKGTISSARIEGQNIVVTTDWLERITFNSSYIYDDDWANKEKQIVKAERDWKNYETVCSILREAKMSSRPSYYSGREAMTCDLDSSKLQHIYNRIVEKFGDVAGDNYINMVAELSDMAATRFLNSLFELQKNDWVWDKSMQGCDVSVDCGMTVLGTMANKFGERHNQSDLVRGDFLYKHHNKIKNSLSITNKMLYPDYY